MPLHPGEQRTEADGTGASNLAPTDLLAWVRRSGLGNVVHKERMETLKDVVTAGDMRRRLRAVLEDLREDLLRDILAEEDRVRALVEDLLRRGKDAYASPSVRFFCLENGRRGFCRSLLGRGGFAEVWESVLEREGPEEPPVIHAGKFLQHLGEEARERFAREERLLRSLSLEGVPRMLGGGEEGGRPFMLLERIHGTSFRELLRARGGRPFPRQTLLRCALDAADLLVRVHAEGIIHGDVSPGNLLLGRDREHRNLWRSWLIDFGISRKIEEERTQMTAIGVTAGTRGNIDPRTVGNAAERDQPADIFSLATILGEAYSGRAIIPHAQFEAWKLRGPVTTPEEARAANAEILEDLQIFDGLERSQRSQPFESLLRDMLLTEGHPFIRGGTPHHRPTAAQVAERLLAMLEGKARTLEVWRRQSPEERLLALDLPVDDGEIAPSDLAAALERGGTLMKQRRSTRWRIAALLSTPVLLAAAVIAGSAVLAKRGSTELETPPVNSPSAPSVIIPAMEAKRPEQAIFAMRFDGNTLEVKVREDILLRRTVAVLPAVMSSHAKGEGPTVRVIVLPPEETAALLSALTSSTVAPGQAPTHHHLFLTMGREGVLLLETPAACLVLAEGRTTLWKRSAIGDSPEAKELLAAFPGGTSVLDGVTLPQGQPALTDKQRKDILDAANATLLMLQKYAKVKGK